MRRKHVFDKRVRVRLTCRDCGGITGETKMLPWSYPEKGCPKCGELPDEDVWQELGPVADDTDDDDEFNDEEW